MKAPVSAFAPIADTSEWLIITLTSKEQGNAKCSIPKARAHRN